MFAESVIKAAKQSSDAEFKAYVTSDNSVYRIKREQSIVQLLKHCAENALKLLDAEENKEIEIKIKKKK